MSYIAFSPDGRFLAGTGSDAMLCVWNVETGELLGRDLAGHKTPPNTLRFLSGDDRLASGGDDGTGASLECQRLQARARYEARRDPKGALRMLRGMDVSTDGGTSPRRAWTIPFACGSARAGGNSIAILVTGIRVVTGRCVLLPTAGDWFPGAMTCGWRFTT